MEDLVLTFQIWRRPKEKLLPARGNGEETFVPSSRTSFYYGPFCGASLAAEGCSIFKRRPSMYVRAPAFTK